MSFHHTWVLLLLAIPFAWLIYSWRSASRRFALALKAASVALVLLALAEPMITWPSMKTAAVILLDGSASIPRDDLNHAADLIDRIARHKHGNWMRVVPFAHETRVLQSQELSHGVHLVPTSSGWANGTNFEGALNDSMATFPAGYVPRIVLISDGNDNEGSALRAVTELQRLGIPVDTIPLSGRPKGGLRLLSVSMPREAYSGEQIPIDLSVASPGAAPGKLEISAEGKPLGSNLVDLGSGTNAIRVHARVKSVGTTSIAGRVSAPGLGEIAFEQAVQLRRARVLYVSDDPRGTETNLVAAFNEAGFDLTPDRSLIERGLSSVQLVVLNNVDLNTFNSSQKNHLEEYVTAGGGLLLIAGERLVYKGEKQPDALDRVLPAELAPPKTEQGTAVALIIDKSSSMEGRKIELARLSAVGVVDRLRPTDLMGVLIFDNSFQWAVPIRRAEDKSMIKRLISGITPDGGTQIAPALGEAYRKILPLKTMYKHVVLLTDGISEEGDSIELAREASQHQVTISTVGLGQDVNRSYLEKIANASGGRSYFLNDPQGLEQILLKDVHDYSGSTSVEKLLLPSIAQNEPILDGVHMESAPPLKGYVRFTGKPSAETILSIDKEKKDPLYVRWQYGLGRAGVFTSDAKSRWAESWVTWPGFDKLWINISRDLLAHTDRSEATAQWDPANRDVLVTYRLGPGVSEPEQSPEMFALGPKGFQEPVALQRISSGVYRGHFHLGDRTGLFRIRPVNDSAEFPETGLYRAEDEFEDYGSNQTLLKQISSLTGGRFNPSPSSIFDAGNRAIYTELELWPALLMLAIALTIAELIARKWKGLVARFQHS